MNHGADTYLEETFRLQPYEFGSWKEFVFQQISRPEVEGDGSASRHRKSTLLTVKPREVKSPISPSSDQLSDVFERSGFPL